MMDNMRLFFNEINRIYDCNLTKIRIGNKHDGGYIALKEICENIKKVYSFGIGDDVGFEMDFIKRFPDSIIQCFDPTIDSLPVYPRNMFSEKILFKKAGPKSLMKVDGGSLLKMDIEGNEWDNINSSEMFNIKNLVNFNQILIEFHILTVEAKVGTTTYFDKLYSDFAVAINDSLFNSYYRVMNHLNKFFYIFHVHPNNSLPKVTIQGYTFPPLIELSLVRKGLVDIVYDTHTEFPVEDLDFPNKTDRPDILHFYPLGGIIDE